jgi:hypothetical protein
MNDEIIFIIDSIDSSGIQIAIKNHKFNFFICHSIDVKAQERQGKEKLFDTNEYGNFVQLRR